MSNEATAFLTKVASIERYTVYTNLSGDVVFADSENMVGAETKVHVSSGSVYCILAVVTCKSDIDSLFEEVGYTVHSIDSKHSLYPIYYGKDIYPGSRIADHVRPRKAGGTGNAELEKIKALRKLKVIFGSIYVENYLEFEQLLHSKHKPLLGTSRAGKKLIDTVVDN